MGITPVKMGFIVATLGMVSFICGSVAEVKKAGEVNPISGKGVVICKYPADPTLALGYISVVFLIASTAAGYYSLFYPYKGKQIPRGAAFQSGWFTSYFNVALFTTGLGLTFLLWPTITKHIHLVQNTHTNLESACPTAKPGLLGGGAFMSLNASLFWLVSLMLISNVREDYFEEAAEDDEKIRV